MTIIHFLRNKAFASYLDAISIIWTAPKLFKDFSEQIGHFSLTAKSAAVALAATYTFT